MYIYIYTSTESERKDTPILQRMAGDSNSTPSLFLLFTIEPRRILKARDKQNPSFLSIYGII